MMILALFTILFINHDVSATSNEFEWTATRVQGTCAYDDASTGTTTKADCVVGVSQNGEGSPAASWTGDSHDTGNETTTSFIIPDELQKKFDQGKMIEKYLETGLREDFLRQSTRREVLEDMGEMTDYPKHEWKFDTYQDPELCSIEQPIDTYHEMTKDQRREWGLQVYNECIAKLKIDHPTLKSCKPHPFSQTNDGEPLATRKCEMIPPEQLESYVRTDEDSYTISGKDQAGCWVGGKKVKRCEMKWHLECEQDLNRNTTRRFGYHQQAEIQHAGGRWLKGTVITQESDGKYLVRYDDDPDKKYRKAGSQIRLPCPKTKCSSTSTPLSEPDSATACSNEPEADPMLCNPEASFRQRHQALWDTHDRLFDTPRSIFKPDRHLRWWALIWHTTSGWEYLFLSTSFLLGVFSYFGVFSYLGHFFNTVIRPANDGINDIQAMELEVQENQELQAAFRGADGRVRRAPVVGNDGRALYVVHDSVRSSREERRILATVTQVPPGNDDRTCTICFERNREVLNLPCRHLMVCRECHVRTTQEQGPRCVLCRQITSETVLCSIDSNRPPVLGNKFEISMPFYSS